VVNPCGIEPNRVWQGGVDGSVSRESKVKEVSNFFIEFPFEESFSRGDAGGGGQC
jgi:ssDNA-binding replication factor A large subunit